MTYVKTETGLWINLDDKFGVGVNEKNGNYCIMIVCDINSQSIIWKSGFKTEKEAQDWLDWRMEKLGGFDFVPE